MKKTLLAFSLLAATASAGFAGESTYQQVQTIAETQPSLYRAGELQIDAFGAYGITSSGNTELLDDDTAGGGIGFNYFFSRWFGIGAEGSLFDTDGDILGTASVNLFLRAPIGESGFAFYGFGGAGVTFNADDLDSDDFSDARDRLEDDDDARDSDDVLFIAHAGVGMEYRFSPNFGIFSDARYTFVERGDSDFGLVRAGLRFVF